MRLKEKAVLEQELTKLYNSADILEKVDQALLQISTKVLKQSTETIDKLVTVGLKSVFNDQVLEFSSTTEKSRGKTAVKFRLTEGGKTFPLTDSFGGGVLAVTGVLLRATTIMVLNLKKVMILDETLANVSEGYIENASKLLKGLCSELGFTILMVTHQAEFASHADRHYQAKRKEEHVTFELVKHGSAGS